MAEVLREAKTKVVHKGERTIKEEKEENAIEYCERMYPETTDEFKKILDEMYVTFCKKQRNYGPGNISVGTDLKSDDDIKGSSETPSEVWSGFAPKPSSSQTGNCF
mgnify:CR=1 FL=1